MLVIRSSFKCSKKIIFQNNVIRNFNKSIILSEKIIELVPALGESITEGSIAKWTKNIGDKINVDDVIVIVETDKVTVDIKSSRSGVLLQQLATDTVIVGNPLYEIDTDSTTIVATTSPVITTITTSETTSKDIHNEQHNHSLRTPLIKFIGKRSLLPKNDTTTTTKTIDLKPPSKQIKQPAVIKPMKPSTGVEFTTLKDQAFFGRPKISLKEMEAIESGGATIIL